MKSCKICTYYYTLLVTLLVHGSHAWNIPAHLFMATIAYNELLNEDAVALFWAEDVLKLHSDSYTQKNEGFYRFIEAVAWADDIRKGYGSWQRMWHFIDIPYVDPKTNPQQIKMKPNHAVNISLALPDLFNWLSGKEVKGSPVIETIMQNVNS